jgi:hypothetical protein
VAFASGRIPSPVLGLWEGWAEIVDGQVIRAELRRQKFVSRSFACPARLVVVARRVRLVVFARRVALQGRAASTGRSPERERPNRPCCRIPGTLLRRRSRGAEAPGRETHREPEYGKASSLFCPFGGSSRPCCCRRGFLFSGQPKGQRAPRQAGKRLYRSLAFSLTRPRQNKSSLEGVFRTASAMQWTHLSLPLARITAGRRCRGARAR